MDKLPTTCPLCNGCLTKVGSPKKRALFTHLKFGNLYCPKCKATMWYALRPGNPKFDKQSVLEEIHVIGGCDALDDFSRGWDSAIDTVYRKLEEILPENKGNL